MHTGSMATGVHCRIYLEYSDLRFRPRGGGRGWGGGGGNQNPIYDIVRMCVPNGPPFQRCQVYDWPPFLNKKYMTPYFS